MSDVSRADYPEAREPRGASLIAADLAGADLRGALLVHQSQLEIATGDAVTQLPSGLARPAAWGVAARRNQG